MNPLDSIELIVLATTKVGDNSLVVHTLSDQWGRRGFLVHVGRKGGTAAFLPLSILEATVVPNPKSELWSLRGIQVLEALPGIRGNMYKNSISLFMAEVLFRTLQEGASEQGLYDWCVGSILTLEAIRSDFSNYHLRFLLELAIALGFRPSKQDLLPFAGDSAPLLDAFLKADLPATLLIPLSGDQRSSLCQVLLRYLEFHTEQPIRIRSLAVLHELFR